MFCKDLKCASRSLRLIDKFDPSPIRWANVNFKGVSLESRAWGCLRRTFLALHLRLISGSVEWRLLDRFLADFAYPVRRRRLDRLRRVSSATALSAVATSTRLLQLLVSLVRLSSGISLIV